MERTAMKEDNVKAIRNAQIHEVGPTKEPNPWTGDPYRLVYDRHGSQIWIRESKVKK